ncbi:MAG: helix-turn-helix transcriptional regulator [Chthonomonadaceae bacterium]|nr:helix-turn-helix transcriptional regulator [Chthonomonadaceae bacterium]
MLSDRETEILELIAKGMRNKEIANHLSIVETIEPPPRLMSVQMRRGLGVETNGNSLPNPSLMCPAQSSGPHEGGAQGQVGPGKLTRPLGEDDEV